MNRPLTGLRVVELASEIAGPYCTKLLVDLGADVCKIEPPAGDPLRRWGPFPANVPDPERCGLFGYLNAGKRGTTVDFGQEDGLAAVHELIATADVLVEDLPAGSAARLEWGLDLDALGRINPGLIVVRISSFGQEGPLRDRVTTPLTLQAAAGWVNMRDPGRAPVQAGARIPEYIAGSYAALGTLTALRIAADGTNRPVEVDVSMFESLLSTLPYPMLMAARLKSLGLPTNSKAAPMLGIVRAADGWIGINCLTGQHWLDVCAMVGLPEFGEHQLAVMLGGPERGEFFAKAQPFLDSMTVSDLVELSQAMRIPAAPVTDGDTILACPQYAERGFFVKAPTESGGFTRPGAPFRFSKTPSAPSLPAPALRSATQAAWGERQAPRREDGVRNVALPFDGLKVFDLSTFWAGAYLTCYLGAFGADVVKVESIQRPDGHRYSGSLLREGEDWYERGPLWQGTNLNKRDITLDLNSAAGRELALRLAAEADVVVENFSPRVVEQFGLDYESLAKINPGVIMVRMPGFGLQGPWRDYVGWALNIEQVSGMSAITGYPDGPPCNLQGPADPIAGVHAGVALLAALEHRRSTGEGQLIEVAQIEVGAAVTAEPVIEYSLTGTVRPREGNRHREYAQGVYPTARTDEWIAISVRDDADWVALLAAIDRDELRDDPRFATAEARRQHHDEFDEVLASWTSRRPAGELVATLVRQRVPAERLLAADEMYDVEQLDARGFYQDLAHPITGRQRFPGWPFQISPGPAHHHRTAAPTLGQHNAEVLGALGLSDADIDALQEQRVIGQRILNA
ncbi:MULTISPECIES: CaiB/BaiF CoA-transferase family protein [unclassified Mycobacterium]|uniref:CaiB/BaiF CoA transferase family protein n=1 Tax=unclassified Mycobacterium TaxID=2642494 RepID=UPI00080046E8|nr:MULTISPECIES: CoA transferase [unclassified Mycobacterium]OBG61012.1 acyl-CoA hydratase [Mycobacterium sp. E735]OBG69781.1 acyl-CoA hydratase [Mycobacterium sp. E3298]